MSDAANVPPAVGAPESLQVHYVIELAGELYALPQAGEPSVAWVQQARKATYLPTLPRWCLGLVNGRTAPVLLVDLRLLLGLPPRAGGVPDQFARQIFLGHNGELLGFLVDRTHRFRLLPVLPTPADGAFLRGSVQTEERQIQVLDPAALWFFVVQTLDAAGDRVQVA